MTILGRRTNCNHLDQGFILLEVLVALALLGVGIVTVLTSVQSSLTLARESETRYRASLLLQQKLTEIKAGNANRAPGGELFGASADSVFQWEVNTEPWPNQLLDAPPQDRDSEAPPDPGLSQITVKVSWKSRQRNRTIQASELILGAEEYGGQPQAQLGLTDGTEK